MEQILPTKIDRDRNFFHTHPADEFRFKVHAKWLTQGGWDSIMELKAKTVFDRLQQCEALSIADFAINCKPPLESKDALENELHAWMLKAFEELVEHIEKKVSSELAEFPKPIDDFDKYNDLVTTSLEYGVVPSTVYDANEKRCHPKPTTILNAGFFFYLGGMGALLEKIKSKNSDTDKRIMYEKRLNEWLSKAIEDWQILNEEEET